MKTNTKRLVVIVCACILSLMLAVSAFATTRCIHSGCNAKTVSGSDYCSTHKCKKSGCKRCGLKKYDGYCSLSHKPSKSTKNSSSKNNSNGKKKYTMPDCDDYDSYEDFMDDWDGCMPDGSDAEDYWENW